MGINPYRKAHLHGKLMPCHTKAAQPTASQVRATDWLGLVASVWLGYEPLMVV